MLLNCSFRKSISKHNLNLNQDITKRNIVDVQDYIPDLVQFQTYSTGRVKRDIFRVTFGIVIITKTVISSL